MMTCLNYRHTALHMEDVDLTALAAKHGTPIYCYSATALTENFMRYHDALCSVMPAQKFTICYATKANSNQAVLTLLAKLGSGADIVSGGELYRARQAGIPAKKIVYAGVGKTEEELTVAIRTGLLQINVESEGELELISKIAQKLKKTVSIAFRINPDVDAKTHKKITTGKKENKFGIDLCDAPRLYNRAKKMKGIAPNGVAVHIGSQLTSLAPYKEAYRRVATLITTLRDAGHDITRVDLGGGIGITYKDETPPDLKAYAKIIGNIIVPLDIHVIIEPGRSIAGNAGILLSRVINVKKGAHKTFVIIDAAMNDLIRPSMYDAYHAIIPCKKSTAKKQRCDIVGPVCETGDTFHIDIDIQPLKIGDLVAIGSGGAYGAVMAGTYNTRPLAGEIMVKNKQFSVIRNTRTVREIVGDDIIPKWIA